MSPMGSMVGINPDAAVEIKGLIKATPDIAPSQPKTTSDGDAIKREVTVFNSVDFGGGEVVTGWKYANGAGKALTNQYCYFGNRRSTAP